MATKYPRNKLSPLAEEQKFFPSVRPRVKDPYKLHQLYMIKQKQKRQNFLRQTKVKMYKEILETETKIKKSKQKYLTDRCQRYDKIRNASFIGLKQKIKHDNRFSFQAEMILQKCGLENRSSSLFFRTLDELQGTIHRINKTRLNHNINYSTIQSPQAKASLQRQKQRYGGSQKFRKYNYRYYDQNNQENQSAQGLMIGGMEEAYKKKRLLQLTEERQRINQMVRMYREYQQSESLHSKPSIKPIL